MNVVLGTGPLGLAVMRALIDSKKPVRMVNTTGRANVPAGVEVVKSNLYDTSEARAALAGAEVVYQCAQPGYHRWVKLFQALQDHIVEAASACGADLVVGDNLYMYGEVDGPIHENLPYSAVTRKGRLRAQMATRLLDAHRQGKVRVAIARGSDFFGPGVRASSLGERVFAPAVAGKACAVLGNPRLLHTYTYIEDFGRAMATLGEHEESFGRAWHVPNADTVTTEQIVQMVYTATGYPPAMRTRGKAILRVGGIFMPDVRETIEMLYQVERPFVVDSRKFTSAFGTTATPLERAIETTVHWYRDVRTS